MVAINGAYCVWTLGKIPLNIIQLMHQSVRNKPKHTKSQNYETGQQSQRTTDLYLGLMKTD